MWRILTAAVAAGVLGAATMAEQLSDGHTTAHAHVAPEPVAAARVAPAPASGAPRDRASRGTGSAAALRSVARIAAEQAGALRGEVRHCTRIPAAPERTRCDHMALAHAAAAAKLNAVILSAARERVSPPCARMAARMGGLLSALAFIAVDGTRSLPWPRQVRASARAAARVAIRLGRAARPAACVPGAGGPLA
jgi:hypothetical protein